MFSSQTSKEISEGSGDDNEADKSKDIAGDLARDAKTCFTYHAALQMMHSTSNARENPENTLCGYIS